MMLRAAAVLLTLAGFVVLPFGTSIATAQGVAPDAPDKPTGEAIFRGGVDLQWNEVVEAEFYDVELYRDGQTLLLPNDGVEIAFYGPGAVISGLNHTGPSYHFRVRASNQHGSSEWSDWILIGTTSEQLGGQRERPANARATGAPTISGTSQVGETLTASNSGIEDDNGLGRVTFYYQWIANDGTTDTDLTDATEASYTLAAADEGKTIKVRVSFTDRGGYSELLTSAATAAIAPPVNTTATGTPKIIGTPWVGETLTASISDIEDDNGLDGVAFAYQWIIGDGNTEEDIEGATGANFTLLAADEGKAVKVRVSFTDNHGFAESLTSAATAAVATTPGAPGNLKVSSGYNWELAATWEPPASDGGSEVISYRVQWKSGSEDYDGTTGSARQVVVMGLSYAIAELTHDVEYTVRVIATNSVGDGAAVEATATPSDTTPPQLSTATVNGRFLELGYDGPVDGDSVPRASDFSVAVAGAAREVERVSVARREVTLILASAVTRSDAVTVSYIAPPEVSEPRILDAIGNAAGSFSDQTVRNNTHPGAPRTSTISEPDVPHGSTLDTATVLTLGAAVSGRIDPGGDEDYFKIELAKAAGLLVRTTGGLDTTGKLLDSSGTLIARNDDGRPGADANFVIWQSLPAGAYYVKVGGYQAAAGLYELHTEAIPDSSSRADAQRLQLNQPANGMVDPRDDEDYFKIELSEATDLLVRTSGAVDTEGALLDSDGSVIATVIATGNFLIRKSLEAGVYYIKVGGFMAEQGPYALHVDAVAEPGRTMAAASPLTLGVPAGGRFDESGGANYFSIVTGSTTELVVQVPGILTTRGLFDSEGERIDPSRLPDELNEVTDTRWRNLPAGSYYLKVVDADSDVSGENDGLYTVIASDGSDYKRFITRCSNIDTDFDDPLYGCHWHLSSTEKNDGAPGEDINVEEVWAAGHFGDGITVAVVDNGVDSYHEDLRANVRIKLNHTYESVSRGRSHGTAVAGIIAALANGLGGRGVAPEATIYSYDLSHPLNYTAANRADAMARNADITAVSNNSWGDIRHGGVNRAGSRWEAAVEDGVATGYGGKGVFYVFAAGNGHLVGDVNGLDEFMTFYAVTAVCAVDDQGLRASYSEVGDNLWVCAPAAEVTTDIDDRYLSSFGGTSAAAPIVSGVAALVRGANPGLTWRDVKLILAASARKNDATNSGWETGALRYGSTTERYTFNREYGFGVVDAKAAVDLAESWTNLPSMKSDSADSGELTLAVPDRGRRRGPGPVTSELPLGPKVRFTEFIEVNIELDHPSLRDLDIELESPTGTVSKLTVADGNVRIAGLRSSFRFGSARHLGEDPSGVWTLRVTDRIAGREGSITRWDIKVYGHGPSAAAGAPTITGTVQVGETLTADITGIADADGLESVTFSYQWLADEAAIVGATGSTYTLADADESKAIKVQVSFTDDAGHDETLTSTATATVEAPPNNPATGAPTISGTVQVGETLTADTSGIADEDGLDNAAFTYQWLAGDTAIQGATNTTYTLVEADEGKAITVQVSFTDDAGNEETLTSTATATVEAPPNNPATGAPTISGTVQVGETLTADTSGIADVDGLENVSFSYQWLADDTAIQGATNSTYTLIEADEGKAIAVQVSFTDDAGNDESLTSAATDVVAAKPNSPATGAPTISGTVQVGETLTADTSGIADEDGLDNAAFSYQWLAGDSDISAATGITYTLADADEGKTVKVRVSFNDDGGNDETLTSAATEAVASNEEPVAREDVAVWSAIMTAEWVYQGYGYYSTDAKKAGSLSPASFEVDGTTYTVKMVETQGWWTYIGVDRELPFDFVLELDGVRFASGDASFRSYSYGNIYRWERTGLRWSDGDTVEVRLHRAFKDETAVNSAATGAPTISGTVQVGETLTADTSGIEDADGLDNAAFSYQWLAGDTEIQGATNADYTLADADEGKIVTVQVSFTDDGGNDEALTSAATAAVSAAPNNPATGAPTITGTVQVGETLTADTSGIADLDGLENVTFSYQWLAGDSDISGATGITYTLADADEGKAIKAQVSFTDDAGNDETLTSAATTTVEAPRNNPATGAPTISGTVQVGETLTADTSGISDADELTSVSYSYQWIRYDGNSDSAISGATASTYTLADPDESKAIKVKVSFTDDAGNDETLTSAATDAVAAKPNSPVTGAPTISGIAQVGETLTADTSGIADADGLEKVTLSYQWLADDTATQGATGSTYTISEADEGKAIKVRVSFTDDEGNGETLTSEATDPVAAVTQPNSAATGAPTISGTAQLGETLTADTSGISDADGLTSVSYSYQWIRNDGNSDSAISGATASTYTLADADEGKTVKVRVSFTDDGGNDETLTSAATEAVAGNEEPVAREDVVAWSAIMTVEWVYQGYGYYSAHAKKAGSLSTTSFTVDGTTYTVKMVETQGWWTYIGVDRELPFDFVLELDGARFASGDASFRSYSYGNIYRWEGTGLSLRDGDAVEVRLLRAFEDETAVNSAATGAPTISGTAQVGEILTADTSGIADEDGLVNAAFTYQWLADNTEVAGATGSTYTLADADEDKAITVQVSFTDDGGNDETLTSAATDAVAAPEPPAKPTGLSATPSHDRVVLTWDDPNDDTITGYVILRRNRETDAQGHFTELTPDTGTAATTYTDDTVAAETPYTYRIKAINEHGTSERSRWVHVETTAAPTPEGTPEQSVSEGDPDLPNDNSTPGRVAVGGSATGAIGTGGDQDRFAVELVAGRTYQFDLTGSPGGGGTLSDTFFRAIYNSEGQYQADSYNDDFDGGRDSRVTFTPPESGTYYARVSGDRDEVGSYTLSVTDVTPQ